jgi:hypothetical protein
MAARPVDASSSELFMLLGARLSMLKRYKSGGGSGATRAWTCLHQIGHVGHTNNNAARTLLELNTASGSGHDGIEVDAVGTTLTRNTTNDNHELGIEAVPGVIDGGGNKAAGNGNALQCTNVTCS